MSDFNYGDLFIRSTLSGQLLTLKYRQSAVPMRVKFRRRSCWRWRAPKTLNEKKQAYIPDEMGMALLNAHQLHRLSKARNLPTSWDLPQIRGDNSWKTHRQTQHRV